MPQQQHVIIRTYSQFWDVKSSVQFSEILEVSTGKKIGHAFTDVDFSKRPPFVTVSDEEYALILTGPARNEPTEPVTGDPLGDAAALKERQSGVAPSCTFKAAVAQPVIKIPASSDPLG